MEQLRLKSLRLKNFKGLRAFKLSTNGSNVSIYGDNGTGKTTLKDAFFWILFNKDGQGRTDFDIKTIDKKTGEVIHNLEHEVEAVLEIDGKEITLRKVYYEKWVRQRGSAEKTFTGHTTDYFINGVPVKKSEYDAKISEIAGRDDIFRLLTDPGYFNEQLHWQERRRILLEVCGDISDADIIAADKELASLKEILANRSIEDHRKIILARKREINEQLEKIPVRIDEVMQGLPDISKIKPEKIKIEIERLKKEQQAKEKELVRIEHGGEIAEKTRQLREIESELLELKNKHWEENEREVRKLHKELDVRKDKLERLEEDIWNLKTTYKRNEDLMSDIQKELERLRQEWRDIDATNFEFGQSDTCPTCGQKIPEEKLEEAREKALIQFNKDKAQKLELITQKGKKQKREYERLQKENQSIAEKVQQLEDEKAQIEKSIGELQTKIKTLQEQRTDISQDPNYQKKLQEKELQEKLIAELREKMSETVAKLKKEIESIDISSLERSLSLVELYNKRQARIEELKAQEKELVREFGRLERELWLLERFIKKKVSMLEEKINSKFKLARFKLFNVLVNGGIEECCETIYEGVPYSTALNNGMKKNIGLDIINTLSEYYGFCAPIWFDNRESVTELIPTKGQLISLVVSEKDKSLRVEEE